MAPGIEPMPPMTAAVNALMPGMEPMVGVTAVGVFNMMKKLATPASAEPMANVSIIMRFTPMPQSVAADLSAELLKGVKNGDF